MTTLYWPMPLFFVLATTASSYIHYAEASLQLFGAVSAASSASEGEKEQAYGRPPQPESEQQLGELEPAHYFSQGPFGDEQGMVFHDDIEAEGPLHQAQQHYYPTINTTNHSLEEIHLLLEAVWAKTELLQRAVAELGKIIAVDHTPSPPPPSSISINLFSAAGAAALLAIVVCISLAVTVLFNTLALSKYRNEKATLLGAGLV